MRWMYVKKSTSCPSYNPGLYTAEQLDDMILANGWVPVANVDDLNNLKTATNQRMGEGTCWDGFYDTGIDKNYVQVKSIDLNGITFNGVTSGAAGFEGIFDGNELNIFNCNMTTGWVGTGYGSGLFRKTGGDVVVRNIRMADCHLSNGTANSSHSVIVGIHNGASISISNCEAFSCTIQNTTTTTNRGYGYILAYCQTGTNVSIEDCSVLNCQTTALSSQDSLSDYVGCGMVCGPTRTTPITMERCKVDALSNMSYTGDIKGGLIANCQSVTLRDCEMLSNLEGDIVNFRSDCSGGLIGLLRGGVNSIIRCKAKSNVKGRFASGGLIGFLYAGATDTTTIDQCSYEGDITGENGDSYGCFIGGVRRNAIITNCYFRGSVNVGELGDGSRAGGAIGEIRSASVTIEKCYGAADVVGTSPPVNAWVALGSATVNDCYFDSEVCSASGTQAIGKTTSELQTPTSNTGIYSAWDAAIWDFGTSSDYPELINTP